jgi:hypothetical protein
MKTKPRDYQANHIELAYDNMMTHGFSGFLYKPGRGKTLSTLGLAEELFKNGKINAMMVICPKNVFKTWKDQLVEHTDIVSPEWRIWDSAKGRTDSYLSELKGYMKFNLFPVFMVSCEAFQRYNETLMSLVENYFKTRNVFLVFDESGKFKNPKSERTKRILTVCHDSKYRVILNGTPTPKAVTDIWAQMELLKEFFWKERTYSVFEYKYAVKMFVKFADGKGGYPKTMTWTDVNDMQVKLDNLNRKTLLSDKQLSFRAKLESEIENITIALRRTELRLEDVYNQIKPFVFYAERPDDLPEVVHENILFDLHTDELKAYKKLKRDLEYIKEDGEIVTMKSKGSLFHKFRQMTGGSFSEFEQITDSPSKIEALLDDVDDHEENCLIITSYRANIRLLTDALNKIGITRSYFGDTSDEDRDELIEMAKRGTVRFIVANSSSIARGVDGLQSSFSMMYVYDIPIDPEDWEQVVYRLDRSGQKRAVVVKHLLADNTIDLRCLQLANDKKNIQATFESMTDDEFSGAV